MASYLRIQSASFRCSRTAQHVVFTVRMQLLSADVLFRSVWNDEHPWKAGRHCGRTTPGVSWSGPYIHKVHTEISRATIRVRSDLPLRTGQLRQQSDDAVHGLLAAGPCMGLGSEGSPPCRAVMSAARFWQQLLRASKCTRFPLLG